MLADAELSPLPPPGLPVKLTDLPPKILQTIATMSQEFPDTHLYPELSVIGRLRQTCWKLRVKIPLSVPVDVVRRFRIGCLTHSDSVLRGKHDDDPLQQEYMSQRQKGAFPCYCRVGRRKADRAYAELEEQRRRLISDSAQDDDDRARSIVAGVPPPRGLSPACPQHLDATDYYNNLVIRALKTGSTLVFQSFHKIDAWRALSEDNPYFTRFIMETAVESRNLDFVQTVWDRMFSIPENKSRLIAHLPECLLLALEQQGADDIHDMATFFLNLEIKLLREPQEQSDGDDNEATERFVSNIIRHGWLPGLRKLIARASIRLVDFKDPVLGVPILCSAAFVGQQSIVAYLLGQAGFDRPEVLTAGLAGAAWSGSLRSARLVLEKGADPNSVFRYPCHFDTAGSDRDLENADDFSDPLPPLHVAAREGHVKVARLLVERGANVHQLAPDDAFHGGDATGPTALCTAAVRGHGEVCAYLVGLGKGASKVRKAEMLATQHGFPDIARLLRGAR